MTAPGFTRPHGVVVAETTRLVEAFEIAEPTLREALEMGTDEHWPFSACTVPELIVAAAEAQRALRAEGQRPFVDREAFAGHWRTMRAANLVLAARATQKIGGPMYA